MTLAQNAQVQKALTDFTFAARTPAASKRDEDMYLVAETRALIDAIRSALLAEWSAGEGLEAAVAKWVEMGDTDLCEDAAEPGHDPFYCAGCARLCLRNLAPLLRADAAVAQARECGRYEGWTLAIKWLDENGFRAAAVELPRFPDGVSR